MNMKIKARGSSVELGESSNMTYIQKALAVKKAMKRENKVSIIAEGIVRGESQGKKFDF
jgi:hypothetical protein